MNSNQAKQIDLVSFLEKLGIYSETKIKDQLFYFSPFREESKPSFNINIKENIWFDYGLSKGGTIIDFVMILKNCEFKNALKYIEKIEKNEVIEKFEKRIKVKSQKKKKIDLEYNLKPLENPLLIKYLESRNLNISICKKFLKEIYYKKNEKEYFGICIENISGGFEIRNSIFKGTIGSKNITEFPGINNKKVNVFEGFIDFISYLTLENQKELQNKNIILNSIMNIKNVDFNEYIEINLYLDNDEIGKKTVQDLEKKFKVIDQSKKYKDFKDINDYLKSI